MKETVHKLEKEGHTLIPFRITKQEHLEMKKLYMQNFIDQFF